MPVFRINLTYEMHQQRDVEAEDLKSACQKILDADLKSQEIQAEWPGKIVRWDSASILTGEE